MVRSSVVRLLWLMQITDRSGVTRVHRHGTGQRYSTATARKGRLASGSAALRRGGSPRIVHRGRNGHRVWRSAVIDFVPIIAQRRSGARFHFYVRDVGRRVRIFGRDDVLFVVDVRFAAKIVCETMKIVINIFICTLIFAVYWVNFAGF